MTQHYAILDVETIRNEAMVPFLAEPKAPANLRDPLKIAAAIEEKRQANFERAALDPWASRPVVLSYLRECDDDPESFICRDDEALAKALKAIGKMFRTGEGYSRTLITFNGLKFDWPHLRFHALRLGVSFPTLSSRRWDNDDHYDLYSLLCDDDCEHVISRSLKTTCAVFGVELPEVEDIDGKDVGAAIAAGNIDAVVRHCEADVMRVLALAEMLKLIPARTPSTFDAFLTMAVNESLNAR